MIKIFKKFNKPEVYYVYYDNGQKQSEKWLLNDEFHKEDGPAYQSWYINGQKKSEYWYLNDKCHREDGHADQMWDKDGEKIYEGWWLNGKQYYSREEWVEELKKIGSPHYEEQLYLLNMEKYNI